jgi:hypothetical protein
MGTFSKLTIKSIVIIALAAFVVGLPSCNKPQSANKDKEISSQQVTEKKTAISVPELTDCKLQSCSTICYSKGSS